MGFGILVSSPGIELILPLQWKYKVLNPLGTTREGLRVPLESLPRPQGLGEPSTVMQVWVLETPAREAQS